MDVNVSRSFSKNQYISSFIVVVVIHAGIDNITLLQVQRIRAGAKLPGAWGVVPTNNLGRGFHQAMFSAI